MYFILIILTISYILMAIYSYFSEKITFHLLTLLNIIMVIVYFKFNIDILLSNEQNFVFVLVVVVFNMLIIAINIYNLYKVNKEEKSKKPLYISILVTILLVIIYSVCLNFFTNDVILISSEELHLILNEENYDGKCYIYIGRDSCKSCKEFEPKFYKLARSDIDTKATYYFYNTDLARENGEDELLDTILNSNDIIVVPTIIYLHNGYKTNIFKNSAESMIEELKNLINNTK